MAHSNAGSLTHWATPGIKPKSSWIVVRFVNQWATMGTLAKQFLHRLKGTTTDQFITFFHTINPLIFSQWFFEHGRGGFCFLGPYPRHREVPRLGVKSEPQLPAYATAIAMQDISRVCDLYHSSQQCQILNPLGRARIEPNPHGY